jgi:protocatechuate 3,4-dioxygenase beta subunit
VNAKISILATSIAAGALVLFLWTRPVREIANEPVAVPSAKALYSDASELPTSLDASAPAESKSDDERKPAIAPTLVSSSASGIPSSPADSACDATLIVQCRAMPAEQPIEGVRVIVSAKDEQISSKYKVVSGPRGSLGLAPITGKNGEVELDLRSGLELEIRTTPGWKDLPIVRRDVAPLERGERRTVVLEFTTGDDIVFHGMVVAKETLQPIASARVSLRDRGAAQRKTVKDEAAKRNLTTGVDGRVEFSAASSKQPFLRVEAPGFGVVLVVLDAIHSTPEQALMIPLERAASIQATVVDGDGAPLAGVEVRISARGYSLQMKQATFDFEDAATVQDVVWSATTGANGQCVVNGITPEKPLRVGLRRQGKALLKEYDTLTLRPAETRALRWEIGGGCTIAGVLIDDTSKPIEGRALWLRRADEDRPRSFVAYEVHGTEATVSTDQSGRFVLDYVGTGTWWVGMAPLTDATRENDDLVAVVETVEVTSGVHHIDLVLKTCHGQCIRGRVRDALGANAPEAFVWASFDDGIPIADAESTEDGRFAIGPLKPGRYQVRASAIQSALKSEAVAAKPGDENIVLQLKAEGSLRGKVVDGSNGSGCRAHVELTSSRHETPGFFGMMTKEYGSFVMTGIEPGRYDLIARAKDGRIAVVHDVQVEPAGAESQLLTVKLEPGAILNVRYDGNAPDRWIVTRGAGVNLGVEELRRGVAVMVIVPKGKVAIEFANSRDETLQRREFELEPGEVKEILFNDDR